MATVRIDFYVLEASATDGRLRLACKIIDRAYRSGYSVYLWTRDDQDIVDQASSYTDKNVEMKAINRQIKLIAKIDQALERIKNGTYGFCAETGEPIGIKRLMARPVAELCIAAQEKHEKEEKVYADD